MAKTQAQPRTSNTLSMLIGFGVFMQIAGGFALGLVLTAEEADRPLALVIAGYVLAGIGSALMFVGLVGWGVLLALRAHSEESA